MKPLAMDGVRFIVFVSDFHSGSSLSLCPPGFRADGGHRILLSEVQRCYWAHWQVFNEFVTHATQGEPFALVLNGDCVEGVHHRNAQVWSVNEDDHIRCAAQILTPLRDRAEYTFLVRGTEAHVGESGRLEESLARLLETDIGYQPLERMGEVEVPEEPEDADDDWNADPIPIRSHWEVWLRLGDEHLVHAAHHIGVTSSTAYELSALSRELAGNLENASQWGDEPASVIVRSHRHRFAFGGIPSRKGTTRIIVTPAWQAKTGFMYRIGGVNMRRPQLGGVVIGVDEWGGIIQREYVWGLPRYGTIPLTRKEIGKDLSRTRTRKTKTQRSSSGKSSSPRIYRPKTTKKAKPRKKSPTR